MIWNTNIYHSTKQSLRVVTRVATWTRVARLIRGRLKTHYRGLLLLLGSLRAKYYGTTPAVERLSLAVYLFGDSLIKSTYAIKSSFICQICVNL